MTQCRIVEQFFNRLGQRGRIVGFDQQSRIVISHHGGDASNGSRYYAPARGERFQNYHRLPLRFTGRAELGRHDDQVSGSVELDQSFVVDEAKEPYLSKG